MSSSVMTTPWPGDDRGFPGMAFHPGYGANGRYYYSLLVTSKPEIIRISEMKVSDPDSESYTSTCTSDLWCFASAARAV